MWLLGDTCIDLFEVRHDHFPKDHRWSVRHQNYGGFISSFAWCGQGDSTSRDEPGEEDLLQHDIDDAEKGLSWLSGGGWAYVQICLSF